VFGYGEVDGDGFYPFFLVLGEALRNVPLAEIVFPQKFISLGEDVERFAGSVRQKGNDGSARPIQDSPIVKDDFCSHQDAGDVVDVVAHLVVVEELAVDSVEDQFFVQFYAVLGEGYPYSRDPLLQT